MTQLRFVSATFAATAVLLLSSLSSAVAARPADPGCGTGPSCAYGFECTVVGGTGCASAACAPGQTCPEPEPCVATQEMGCTPAHCTSNAECSAGMLCHAWEQPCAVTDCACAPDVPDCGCGTTTCEPTTVSMCTPRYLLPCSADAECGDGFTCQEQMTGCATPGSAGGSDPAPAGAPLPPDNAGGAASDPIEPAPAPDCSPEPSGIFQCVVKEIACTSAVECPAGWSCEQESYPTAGPCAPNTDCTADPIPMPVSSVCRPPYYAVDSSGGLEAPGVPTSEGTGKGTAGGDPSTPAPQANNADDGTSHDSAACQMGHAPASSGIVSLLAMLGALLGLKRRRRAHG